MSKTLGQIIFFAELSLRHLVDLPSSVRALMENLSLTAEQAMKVLNVAESEQEGYLARL